MASARPSCSKKRARHPVQSIADLTEEEVRQCADAAKAWHAKAEQAAASSIAAAMAFLQARWEAGWTRDYFGVTVSTKRICELAQQKKLTRSEADHLKLLVNMRNHDYNAVKHEHLTRVLRDFRLAGLACIEELYE